MPPPPKLLVNVFFLQWIDVVTFFECVSRPAKSPGICVSVHKWPVISRSPVNVKKIYRNWGNLIDLDLQLPEKNVCHYPPPPQRIGSTTGNHGTTPPHRISEITYGTNPPLQTKILATPLYLSLVYDDGIDYVATLSMLMTTSHKNPCKFPLIPAWTKSGHRLSFWATRQSWYHRQAT